MVAEFAVPLAALAGLEPVFVAHRHEDTLVGEALQRGFNLGAELAVVGGQIVHKQVGDVVLVGADTGIETVVALQLADEEDKAADPAGEIALVLADLDDALVALTEEHAGVD